MIQISVRMLKPEVASKKASVVIVTVRFRGYLTVEECSGIDTATRSLLGNVKRFAERLTLGKGNSDTNDKEY